MCSVFWGTAVDMACSISLTADMAGEGTECRSPTRHPLFKSTTAALMEDPPISIPIACRCIPRPLAAMLVQREAIAEVIFGVRAPACEGAYDTGTRMQTYFLHALSVRQQQMSCNVSPRLESKVKGCASAD